MSLWVLQQGILEKYGVELIGAKLPSINKAEDRELFKVAMEKIGLKTPQSGTATNMQEAMEVCSSAHPSPAASPLRVCSPLSLVMDYGCAFANLLRATFSTDTRPPSTVAFCASVF